MKIFAAALIATSIAITAGCSVGIGGRPVVQIGPNFLNSGSVTLISNATELWAVWVPDLGRPKLIPPGKDLSVRAYGGSYYGGSERAFLIKLYPSPDQYPEELIETLTGRIWTGYERSHTFVIRRIGDRGGYKLDPS